MDDVLTQLATGGIFAVLVIREVLTFLKGRSPDKSHACAEKLLQDVEAIHRQTHELHRWHAPNESGQQTWKNTEMIDAVRELTEVVHELKDVVANNTQVSARLLPVLERMEAKG